MNNDIDKTIHEKVVGKCWHIRRTVATIHNNKVRCISCGEWAPIVSGNCFEVYNPSYTTNPVDYWDLVQYCRKQVWWNDFWEWYYNKCSEDYSKRTTCKSHPDGFPMSCSIFWQVYLIGNLGPGNSLILDMESFCQAIVEFSEEKDKESA